MECAKCRAHNSDDAVFCSLCFENFKPKAKTASGSGSRKVAFPTATTKFEGWTANGPLVVSENGIYFFVKGIKKPDQAKGAGGTLASQIGGQFGLLGSIAGDVAGSLIDDALDDGSGGAGLFRPPKVIMERTAGIIEQCQDILSDAPNLPACKEYFTFQKTEIQALEMTFLSALEITTRFLALTVSGMGSEGKLTSFLTLKGYPLKK